MSILKFVNLRGKCEGFKGIIPKKKKETSLKRLSFKLY